MYKLMDLLFGNIFLVVLVIFGIYIYKVYKDLKEKQNQIKEKFDTVLDKYLQKKIDEANIVVQGLLAEYKEIDEVKIELDRLNVNIEKGIKGQINEKVQTSNDINKFKLGKHIDLNKYPSLEKIKKLGTFTEEDMDSLDNGVAIARKEYNALAFRYNEKSSGFPIQYLTKLLGLSSHYVIFDAPKSKAYEEKFEVFEEKEPEINAITMLNQQNKKMDEEKNIQTTSLQSMNQSSHPTPTPQVQIQHSDTILKPTLPIDQQNNTNNQQ